MRQELRQKILDTIQKYIANFVFGSDDNIRNNVIQTVIKNKSFNKELMAIMGVKNKSKVLKILLNDFFKVKEVVGDSSIQNDSKFLFKFKEVSVDDTIDLLKCLICTVSKYVHRGNRAASRENSPVFIGEQDGIIKDFTDKNSRSDNVFLNRELANKMYCEDDDKVDFCLKVFSAAYCCLKDDALYFPKSKNYSECYLGNCSEMAEIMMLLIIDNIDKLHQPMRCDLMAIEDEKGELSAVEIFSGEPDEHALLRIVFPDDEEPNTISVDLWSRDIYYQKDIQQDITDYVKNHEVSKIAPRVRELCYNSIVSNKEEVSVRYLSQNGKVKYYFDSKEEQKYKELDKDDVSEVLEKFKSLKAWSNILNDWNLMIKEREKLKKTIF